MFIRVLPSVELDFTLKTYRKGAPFYNASLRRTLACYFQYYHESRTHLSLGKDSPEPRPIQPPEMGRVVAVPQVGGLHHRYERRAA
jgi:hypothetical protein